MEMEFMAEFTEGISRDRARQIIKGKRTKRQRPSSPFATSTTSANSTDCFIDNQSSSEMSTKEDEDMANCLIMLAQSVSPVKEEDKSDQIRLIRQKTDKLSSRRFTEMTTVGAKAGFYAYECKTCNRTFPSFQALGGHRASHKKPKVNVDDKKSIPLPLTEYAEEVNDHDQHKAVAEDEENKGISIISISNNIKGKVHECSICGSEFLSGQALGGHMRKHRPVPVPVSVNRTVISMNTDDNTADDQTVEKSSGGMLSLDLNFPPPELVEEHRQSQFPFTGGSSQQHLVFSGPAFVDCHY